MKTIAVTARVGATARGMVANLLMVWVVCWASLPATIHSALGAPTAATVTPAPRSVLWVLSIGVSRYQQTDFNLKYAAIDAQTVAAALGLQAGGPLYSEARTLVLTDAEVTRETILDSMERFLGQAGPNDVAVIFVAGHGVQDRATGSYYFLPSSATSQNHVTAGVRMSDFDEMVRIVRHNVRGVVLMLDTCHAGALKVAAPNLAAMEDPAARLSASEGFFLLAASKPGEESQERAELGHGAFSYALLEGLQGAADANNDRNVSVTELFGYVAREVASLTGGAQNPYYKVEGTDLRLVAAKSGITPLTPRPGVAVPLPTTAVVPLTPVPNTVAVMDFRNVRTDPDHEWVGSALRAAFNTELSKVRELNVYAPELIDRTMKLRGTDELAAAQQLGIDRLVAGSFNVVGEAIRIDARIVYASSGLQEGSDSVQGNLSDFLDLQKQLVFSVLRRMHVSLSPEEGSSIERKTNTDVNAYRLLLETEEVVENPTPHSRKRPTPPAKHKKTGPRSGWEEPWYRHVLSFASVAYAAEINPATEGEVRKLIEDYRQALERKDLDRLAQLYVSFPTRRRESLRQYFENARQFAVEVADLTMMPHGDDIVVSYTRRDHFIDGESGKPVNLEVRLTRVVVRQGGTWKIAGKP
ncbi:MAG: caspase family protein [Deltaproteobacteria bacterium]|nr:caspase family protein [Deltaproteobacteria bacterium]